MHRQSHLECIHSKGHHHIQYKHANPPSAITNHKLIINVWFQQHTPEIHNPEEFQMGCTPSAGFNVSGHTRVRTTLKNFMSSSLMSSSWSFRITMTELHYNPSYKLQHAPLQGGSLWVSAHYNLWWESHVWVLGHVCVQERKIQYFLLTVHLYYVWNTLRSCLQLSMLVL